MSSVKCLCCKEEESQKSKNFALLKVRFKARINFAVDKRLALPDMCICTYHPAGVAQVSNLDLQLVSVNRVQGVQ